jgi:hypothetical protein
VRRLRLVGRAAGAAFRVGLDVGHAFASEVHDLLVLAHLRRAVGEVVEDDRSAEAVGALVGAADVDC